jgi:hypothetical protein
MTIPSPQTYPESSADKYIHSALAPESNTVKHVRVEIVNGNA